MSTIQINIDDILLEVEYEFDEGEEGGYFEPSSSDSIEIISTTLDGNKTDITDLLSQYVINRIEDKIYHYERLA
jgi:hypothetical protein